MVQLIQDRLDEDTRDGMGRQLCELAAHLHAALADLAQLAATFDSAQGWAAAGIRSCSHWLSIEAGLDTPTSADLLRVGHALTELARLREAFAAGRLSLDKVRALVGVATPADEELWLELALGTAASQLVRICREYRRSLDADAGAEERMARRGLWARPTEDGMLRLVALLPPEEGALVLAAIEAVARARGKTRPEAGEVADPALEPWAASQVDALVAVYEHALAAGPDELVSAPEAARMVVHVDVGVLTGEQPEGRCHLEDGTPLAAAAARRLGCDAEVVAVTERDGLPIDVGRTRRLVSRRLRRALHARDRTCRFPGCPVAARRTHAHHIVHWTTGGRTDLANLLSVCWYHHARLHDGAYRIRRGADGELRFETPDGREIGARPAAPVDPVSGGAAHLRCRHRARGLAIGPTTPEALWRGEPCDIHHVTDVYAEACASARTRAGPPPADGR
jgi:hypothetical protein